jgi:hypothetical protein
MKRFALGVLSVFFACSLLAGNCGNVDIMAHGTVHYFADTDCWQFAADDGSLYQIVYASPNVLRNGLTGLMSATWSPLMMPSVCGSLVNVCSFDADNTVNLVGTLRYRDGFEGGCWTLEVGNKSYQPESADDRFYRDGEKVKVQGILRPDVYTLCMTGPVVEVVDWTFLGAAPAQCQQTARECAKVCSENPCLISCDTVFSICLDSCQ